MAFRSARRNDPTRPDDRSLSHTQDAATTPSVRSHTSNSMRSGIPSSGGKLLKRRPGREGGLMQEAKAAAVASASEVSTGSTRAFTPDGQTLGGSGRAQPLQPPHSIRMMPTVARTPSLVSGSSVSTNDSPRSGRSGVLRKKQSVIGKSTSRSRGKMAPSDRVAGSNASSSGGYQDPFPEAVLGIAMPSVSGAEDRDSFESIAHPFITDDLPRPPALPSLTMSPSTMYSASTSPFSHVSASTSITSPSPVAGQTSRMTPLSQHSSPLKHRIASPDQKFDPFDPDVDLNELAALKATSTTSSMSSVGPPSYNMRKDPPRSRLPGPSPAHSTTNSRRNSGNSLTSPRSTLATRQQRPPELAHLADARPSATSTKTRPPRPSREGTSDISGLKEASPVIHSNLVSLTPAGSRRPSYSEHESSINAPSNSNSRVNLPIPSKSSRNPSPSPSGISTTSSKLVTSRRPSADGSNENCKPKKSSSTSSPSKFGSRFGFFRRTKTEPASLPAEKQARKGPVAGTGHEGYGKYGRRGRSGSSASIAGSVGRSASADSPDTPIVRAPGSRKSSFSSQGQSDVDDFFLERLAPKVIRGEGARDPFATTTPQATFAAKLDLEKSRPRLLPSALPASSGRASPLKQKPMGISDSGRSTPTLAERRSFRRSKFSNEDLKPLKIPSKVNTSIPSAISSYDSSLADQSSVPDSAGEGKEGFWLRSKKKEQQAKQSKQKIDGKSSRKWNPFQTSHKSQKNKNAQAAEPVTEEQPVHKRAVAHYAIVHPHTDIDPMEIDGIVKEAELAGDDSDYPGSSRPTSTDQASGSYKTREPSMLLPMSPKHFIDPPPAGLYQQHSNEMTDSTQSIPIALSPEIPLPLNTQTQTSAPVDTPAKPSRLPQVGRIPKVVSNRDYPKSPPEQSFSRPFSPLKTAFSPLDILAEQTQGNGDHLTDLQHLNHAITTEAAINSAQNYVTSPEWTTNLNSPEFFAFGRRKNSQASYSSSSGASYNAITTAITATTGPLPSPDEVWKEYDDLIDEVLSPSQSPSHDVTRSAKLPAAQAMQQIPVVFDDKMAGRRAELPHIPLPPMGLEMLEPPPLLSSFKSAGTLGTTGSVTNLIAGYGERNLSTLDIVLDESNNASAKRESGSTFRSSVATSIQSEPDSNSTPPDAGSLREKPTRNRYRDTMLMEMAEAQNDGMESMANLRFDALMTSKWLSFGRVLFSPAHLELRNPAENRVLVLDGLGKDWSFYCALTYPGATVYNLGPDQSDAMSGLQQPGAFESLPNHRHVHHPYTSHPFPFPRGFFNAVVLRFPVASPEIAYRFTISECKRVLRPGGHLEISALDLDMMNMGNRARRAIRDLKTRMQDADPSVSLKSASDNIQCLLGRRGFENLNRCMVGVPVAGRVPDSSSNSLGGDNNSLGGRSTAGSRQSVNFSDVLGSSSNNGASAASDDEGITQMVARVGRWWYSRCYEALVLPDGDLSRSIWSNDALLRECEELQTSFRLLVCYAQKPTLTPRRTISV